MPAKPVAASCRLGAAALCLLGGLAPVHAKAPLPTVLLYSASPGDVPALVDLRTRLRLDGLLQVLTYDPDSASVKRVAAEASHPEWLTGPLSDDARLALARQLGVAFYVVVSPGRQSDSTHLQLVQTAPPALTFDWYGVNRQFGARALESQAQAALGPAVSAAGDTAPALVAPAPAPALVAPAPTSPKPFVTAPPPPITSTVKPVPTPEAVPLVKPTLIPDKVPSPAPASPVVAPASPVVAPASPVVAPASPVVAPASPVVAPASPVVAPASPVVAPPVPLVAALPPRDSILTPPFHEVTTTPTPEKPVPARDVIPLTRPAPSAEDLAAIRPLMSKGDLALESGDVVGAISLYRQAVNGAPLSIAPRLKLAQAYQKGGMSEKALDEARRALEVAPDNQPVQQLLTELDQENGTTDGALTRYRVLIERSPDDPAAHLGLAESLWNSGDLAGAEAEYKTAKRLAPSGDHAADAHLAQLYAAQARYDDCLSVLQDAGKDGYALAVKIVKNRADTLSSTIESSRDAFAGGKSTREQFYNGAKITDAQAQALAGFVARLTPPAEYKLSHLHRMLSTNLLAQEAATLRAFIETGDAKQGESVSTLEKAAQTEMLTAQASEEKLGLWDKK